MFEKILVPVDFSDTNAAALTTALRLTESNGGEVILLHVIETLNHSSFEEERAFYKRLEKRAVEAMAQLDASSKARQKILFGHRVSTILDFAEQEKCDLIVLSSRRHEDDDARRGFTISQSVALLASCSVLLAK